jgi:hypothetical protein
MTCVYCGSAGPFTDEHVLARALAGSGENWMLRELVCRKCNTLFSTYERAWTSEPGVAMARIYRGPAGRARRGQAYQVHPSENIFMHAKGDPVAYEVDILRGIKPRLRAQLIATSDAVFPAASDANDLARLNDATNAFWKNREITIQKRRSAGPRQFRVAVLSLNDTFACERIEWRQEPPPVWLDRFPDSFNLSPDPRMSVDAFGRLRFRTRKLRHIIELLNRVLLAGECKSRGGSEFTAGSYELAVSSVYDIPKVHRAVAKTLVNYAVDEFGAGWIASPGFRPILDYCLGRIDDLPSGPFVGVASRPTGISKIDEAPPERHALALCSNGALVVGLVGLYGGSIYKVHLGPAPSRTGQFVRSLQIDYCGRGRV